jgi:hypothetical protein
MGREGGDDEGETEKAFSQVQTTRDKATNLFGKKKHNSNSEMEKLVFNICSKVRAQFAIGD